MESFYLTLKRDLVLDIHYENPEPDQQDIAPFHRSLLSLFNDLLVFRSSTYLAYILLPDVPHICRNGYYLFSFRVDIEYIG